MCYLSPEGVVLGADSTASLTYPDGFHYFNHAQKLFQVGNTGSLGILTWGLGGLGETSYRTLIADLADDLEVNPPASLEDVANRWAGSFWVAYSSALAAPIQRCRDLHAKPAAVPGIVDPAARTDQEEAEYNDLRHGLVVGFCVAGAVPPNRRTGAYEIVFEPLLAAPPIPIQVQGAPFWGAPNMIQRLIIGADPNLRSAILASGNWSGTEAELDGLMVQQRLSHAILPIRDAIDFVYTCIYSTIKALKFSSLQQICGGPIEIAIITTDRPFRWVRHKAFDAAISEGERP
jgi:hypothetical protein